MTLLVQPRRFVSPAAPYISGADQMAMPSSPEQRTVVLVTRLFFVPLHRLMPSAPRFRNRQPSMVNWSVTPAPPPTQNPQVMCSTQMFFMTVPEPYPFTNGLPLPPRLLLAPNMAKSEKRAVVPFKLKPGVPQSAGL